VKIKYEYIKLQLFLTPSTFLPGDATALNDHVERLLYILYFTTNTADSLTE